MAAIQDYKYRNATSAMVLYDELLLGEVFNINWRVASNPQPLDVTGREFALEHQHSIVRVNGTIGRFVPRADTEAVNDFLMSRRITRIPTVDLQILENDEVVCVLEQVTLGGNDSSFTPGQPFRQNVSFDAIKTKDDYDQEDGGVGG